MMKASFLVFLSGKCLTSQVYQISAFVHRPVLAIAKATSKVDNRNHNAIKTRGIQQQQQLQMNFLSDIGDMLSGGKLVPQSSIPYSPALCETNSILDEDIRTLAIRERGISFTGEDFDVFDVASNSPFARVRGAMLHLPGKDKMKIRSVNDDIGLDDEVLVLDRKLVSVTPTYDIYRGGMNAEKVGWIEKEIISMTETFDVYMEGKGGFGPFKPPPAYSISGDFFEKDFIMKNDKGEVVAKVQKDGFIQFDQFNHYQVQVAPGMDAMLVVACACVIDEELDEEHQEKRRKMNEG